MALDIPAGPLGLGKPGLKIAGGFTPPNVSNLQAWWDFAALNLADATAISSVTDSSGNGHTLTQVTGANQPLYKIGIQNGRGVARFDGVNDDMACASFAHGTVLTYFFVGMVRGAHGTSKRIYSPFASSVQPALFDSAGVWAVYPTQATAVQNIGGSTGSFTVFTGRVNSLSSHDARLNGGSWVNFDPADPTGTSVMCVANTTTGAADACAVDACAIVQYAAALSDANCAKVERYLGARFGITVA